MNTTVLNALPIAITYRDGKTETIELRELTIRQLYKFIEFFGDNNSPALAALCAGREDNWSDTLSDSSYAAVVKEAIRLNFPRAETIMAGDVTVAARLTPVIRRVILAESMIAGMPLNWTSGAPAASASPVVHGNPVST